MKWSQWVRLRKTTQFLSFAFFIYLTFAVVERRIAPALADIFFRFDPLSALGSVLASREWIPRLGLALITILVTLVVGRAWCGWICPLGTLLEWVSFKRARDILVKGVRTEDSGVKGVTILRAYERLRKFKYYLLFIVLMMAVLGSLALLSLDPLAIFTRTMTTSILPALFYGINSLEKALYQVGFMTPVVDWFEGLVRGNILPSEQPLFNQNLGIATLFFGILALNLLAHRFWCRYLCPLGALLGILSKVSVFRPVIGDACNHCSRCAQVCRPGAIQAKFGEMRVQPSECTLCLDCLASCRLGEMHLHPQVKPVPKEDFDLSRREALGALASGTAAVLLLGSELRRGQPSPWRIRPPGVVDEEAFLSTCLRCSQCMKICPTTALQPAFSEAGLEGLWTPIVVPRLGYCDYGCTACGQVCPTGAIPLLTLDEKRSVVMGKARIDRDRCLPWASATTCVVCEEMCPTPDKSIRLEEVTVIDDYGMELVVQQPTVLREVCIGCGICEEHCPLEGEAAIRVYDA
jgi:polyferredoxin/formate hydrogenlyase subunit 6/NADH:ubiquinone oxidoreductase subunit I